MVLTGSDWFLFGAVSWLLLLVVGWCLLRAAKGEA